MLLLLQELQRLKVKCEEALSESEGLRGECERLTAAVETLRAAEAASASYDGSGSSGKTTVAVQPGMEKYKGEEDVSPSVQEAREEIIRLKKTIEELERAREEVDAAQGRAQCNDKQEGEREELGEARRPVFEERDSLRAELGEEKQKAAARVAGLEMQLADKEVRILPNQPTNATPPPLPSAPMLRGHRYTLSRLAPMRGVIVVANKSEM